MEDTRLILTKSGQPLRKAWEERPEGISYRVDDRETEIIPLLLADVMAAEAVEDVFSAEKCQVTTKVSFTKPEASHVILVAPRSVDQNTAPWLPLQRGHVGLHSLV